MRKKSLLLIYARTHNVYATLLCFRTVEKALNIILSKTPLVYYYGINVGGVVRNAFGVAVGHMTNVSGCLTKVITIIIIRFFFLVSPSGPSVAPREHNFIGLVRERESRNETQ